MSYVNSKRYDGVQLYRKKNKDISYYIRYRDENNKLVRVKVGDKSKGITEPFCKRKRDEIINRVRLGEDVPLGQKKKNIITIHQLSEVYFNDKDLDNKSNQKMKNRYNHHLKETFGDMDIEKLTRDDVIQLRIRLIKAKKAPQTINCITILLNAIINYSIKEKGLKYVNPLLGMKKLKADNSREKFLSIDEINKLKSEVIYDTTLFVFVELALNTGGRLETLLNVQKKDIDLVNGIVTLKDMKNSSTYRAFISEKFKLYLSRYLRTMSINDYLVGGNSVKYPTTNVQRKLKTIFDELFNQGLDSRDFKNRVVIHTLRHTFASHLAINGTPIFTIQKLMNHSDINMTMRYAKLSPDSGREFVSGLYS